MEQFGDKKRKKEFFNEIATSKINKTVVFYEIYTLL